MADEEFRRRRMAYGELPNNVQMERMIQSKRAQQINKFCGSRCCNSKRFGRHYRVVFDPGKRSPGD